jgi:hypothetical protein
LSVVVVATSAIDAKINTIKAAAAGATRLISGAARVRV